MSYCWQELSELPPNANDGQPATLDISHNHFRNLASLRCVQSLKTLIADDNELESDLQLPQMDQLEILSLNKNKISDLEQLCSQLAKRAPRLEFLSLLGNPVAPDNIFNHINQLAAVAATSEGAATTDTAVDLDEGDLVRYRLLAAHLLPRLRYLDSSPITGAERREAAQRGRYLVKVRPRPEADSGRADQSRDSSAAAAAVVATASVSSTSRSSSATAAAGAAASSSAATPMSAGASAYTPLPGFGAPQTDAVDKAAFGKSRYIYYGKHSEGNRFIRNNDL